MTLNSESDLSLNYATTIELRAALAARKISAAEATDHFIARIEALELLGMTLAHLNEAESRGEVSPRIPLLMAIRDRLAAALREDS